MSKTVEELTKELDDERAKAKALTTRNDRLEDESKKNKTRAQTAEDKILEGDKAKLEEQGKLEELLAVEREENKKLNTKLITRTSSVLKEKLRAEVANEAKDAHNVDRILGVTEHKDLLSINEDDLTVSGVKEFVSKVRESDPYLFKKKSLDDTEDKKPKGDTKTDDEKYYAELDAANSRKDMDAVRKKYGRA